MYSNTDSIMANDSTQATLAPEEWSIDMDDSWLVLWWCRQLGLTKSQLEHAVRAVGNSIVEVKDYLAKHPVSTNQVPA
jgi:hypothetical protein